MPKSHSKAEVCISPFRDSLSAGRDGLKPKVRCSACVNSELTESGRLLRPAEPLWPMGALTYPVLSCHPWYSLWSVYFPSTRYWGLWLGKESGGREVLLLVGLLT